MRRGAVVLALVPALAALAACEHAQPFGAASREPNVPFVNGFPRQLTFSAGADLRPAWLPDGSGIIYSFELVQQDHDRCLGILPAEGGHLTQSICHVPAMLDADSTNVLTEPAVGPGGRLAYLRATSMVGALSPSRLNLVVASLDDPEPGRAVIGFPYTAVDGLLHASASHLAWVGSTALVYLAEQVTYFTHGSFADTIVAPLEIVQASLAGDSATLTLVPGTAGATSLAVDSSGAIIFTLPGDTHVYRLASVGGAPGVLYDFGSAGVPSDVQVSGKVLVALIGSRLVRARVGDSVVVQIPSPDTTQTMRRPALAPSGSRVVVELSRNAPANLWLLQVP